VKVWDKCFAGQIHCLIGLEPGTKPLKEFETMVKAAMKECFAK
jgi:acetyl esterase